MCFGRGYFVYEIYLILKHIYNKIYTLIDRQNWRIIINIMIIIHNMK